MALLMPDLNLRRKRRAFENFWLRAIRGDRGEKPNEVRGQSDEADAQNVTQRERIQAKEVETEIREEQAAVEKPPLSTRRGRVETPPLSIKIKPHLQQPPTSRSRVRSNPRSRNGIVVATPPSTQRGRYVKRVQGPTLAQVLDHVRRNEGEVTELDFSNLASKNKRLEAQGGVLVARVLMANRTVKKLVIRDHAIGDRGAVAIANMLRFNSTLEYIDLYSNDITDVGANALASALYGHESLQNLSLWSNAISDSGAMAFASALRCNHTLKYLGLVHNRITAPGAQALLDALEVNVYLETLNLATNVVPLSITTQIRVSLARNRVEAPRLLTKMKDAAEEVKQRLKELQLEETKEELNDAEDDGEEQGEDDYDDGLSDASGFLSCSGVASGMSYATMDEERDNHVWI